MVVTFFPRILGSWLGAREEARCCSRGVSSLTASASPTGQQPHRQHVFASMSSPAASPPASLASSLAARQHPHANAMRVVLFALCFHFPPSAISQEHHAGISPPAVSPRARSSLASSASRGQQSCTVMRSMCEPSCCFAVCCCFFAVSSQPPPISLSTGSLAHPRSASLSIVVGKGRSH